MRSIAILGASGHGKVVADIALRVGDDDLRFLDDAEGLAECAGFPVVGKAHDLCKAPAESDFFIAIGNVGARTRGKMALC